MVINSDHLVSAIRERQARVVEQIESAARRANRSPDSVQLVVVTKAQPLPVVRAAILAGARILGENYAEEAIAKMEAMSRETAPSARATNGGDATHDERADVKWHMIGHIQSRKAKLVVPKFDLIHSVDTFKLAERLDKLAANEGRSLPVLLEFNVGGEASKRGWPAVDEGQWSVLVRDIEAVSHLSHLRVDGLMTMPPPSTRPEEARIYFRRLRRLQDFMQTRLPEIRWKELSMGTSADYTVAVEEGATLVRIGEAILGPRPARETA